MRTAIILLALCQTTTAATIEYMGPDDFRVKSAEGLVRGGGTYRIDCWYDIPFPEFLLGTGTVTGRIPELEGGVTTTVAITSFFGYEGDPGFTGWYYPIGASGTGFDTGDYVWPRVGQLPRSPYHAWCARDFQHPIPEPSSLVLMLAGLLTFWIANKENRNGTT